MTKKYCPECGEEMKRCEFPFLTLTTYDCDACRHVYREKGEDLVLMYPRKKPTYG